MRLIPGLLAIAAVSAGCQRDPPSNLLLICIDTVRYDSFLQTALPDALDPWLDRAQIYDDAVATGPWTLPSVASTLTGHYPAEHGAGRFQPAVANLAVDPPSALAAGETTLAERLAAHGMRTGAFVSHPFFLTGLGLDQGFEVVHAAKGWMKDVENFQNWKQQLQLQPTDRFFAYLHFMEAHDRHTLDSQGLLQELQELDPTVRADVRERASVQACQRERDRPCLQHQVYNVAVLELRSAIASILEDLESGGLLEDTIVLVYSDHGEEFWEHRREQAQLAEDPRGYYGFGHGQSMYQELLHVPLLAWIPHRAGARHQQTVSLIDVLPSVLAWLGVEDNDQPTSGKVLPVSSRWGGRKSPERVIYSSGIAYGPEKIVARSGSQKSVFTPLSGRSEYYDLALDPGELRPLSDRTDLIMLFDTLIGDYLDLATAAPVASSRFDADQIRALQAIGYLQGVNEDALEPPAADAEDDATSEADPP